MTARHCSFDAPICKIHMSDTGLPYQSTLSGQPNGLPVRTAYSSDGDAASVVGSIDSISLEGELKVGFHEYNICVWIGRAKREIKELIWSPTCNDQAFSLE